MLARVSSAAPLPTTAASRSAAPPALALGCVLLTLLAWLPSVLGAGFSFDDREAIEGNPVVEGAVEPLAAFERDYWEHLGRAGHYRPVAALSLRADRALYGGHEWGFHLTNALLHAAVVGAAAMLLVLLGGGSPPQPFPWFGLALFAAHPLLADSIAWISGRTSMLSALGAVTAALWTAHLCVPWRPASPLRHAQAAFVAALGLAFSLFAKEDALVLAPLIVLVASRHSARLAFSSAAGCALAIGAYAVLRAGVYGSAVPSAPHAPLAGEMLAARLAVGGRAFLEFAHRTVAPLGFPPNYEGDWDALSRETAVHGLLGWTLWCALASGGVVSWVRRPQSLAGPSMALCAASTLPWMQLAPAGVVFAPRLAYLPLLLAAPAISAAARVALGRRERLVGAALVGVLCALSWARGRVYHSRASYWTAQAAARPDDARSHNELGLAHEERGDLLAARASFLRAIEIDADYGRPWSNLARLELLDGRVDAAETALERAVELGKGNAVAWSNLGAVRLRMGDSERARDAYRRACELAPGLVAAWRGRARCEFELGQLDDAQTSITRALELDPRDASSLEWAQRIDDARR